MSTDTGNSDLQHNKSLDPTATADSDVRSLIERARQGESAAVGALLERYRNYLRAIAARRMAGPLWRRMDASDLVQQTLLDAQNNLQNMLEGDEPALRAGLRHILCCNVANAIRDHLQADKRRVTREQSFASAACEPSAAQSSPSLHLARREQSLRFLNLLEQLPGEQADAVRMRYFDGLSVGTIAATLGRSRAAAAGLLKRGLMRLRECLSEESF